MIHFHIGSQISEISPLKKALREAGNIHAELYKMGAHNLKAIDLGGGLAVEYTQHEGLTQRHYTLEEYASDVVFLLKTIAFNKHVPDPDIFIEAGRFVAAKHAVTCGTMCWSSFPREYDQRELQLKEENPKLIDGVI